MGTVLSILGLWPRYIGGSEIYLRELAQQLDDQSWQSVACFTQEPTAEAREFLEAANIKIEILENAQTPNFATFKKFVSLMRKYRPEIIHLHLVGFLGFYPWAARLISARRIFFTDHGSRPEGYEPAQAPFWKRVAVRMINWPLTRVISVSEFNRNCMTTLNLLPRDRFARVYNAVDFSRISNSRERGQAFREKHHIPLDRTVVLQVSWIIPAKGIDDVLAAARLVVAANPKVHFVLVGEGNDRVRYMKLAEEQGLENHITWTGLVDDPFGEGVYDAADIVCQASRWQEAFGQVIAEAMASGKPVVATKVGGIPEVVQDGKTAFLINKNDPNELAAKLLLLAGDPELQLRMGQAGREFARQNFELRDMVKQVLSLYDVTSLSRSTARQTSTSPRTADRTL